MLFYSTFVFPQKKAHSEKLPFDEEEVLKDYTLKKTLRDTAVEVEKMEGRGQLKVKN